MGLKFTFLANACGIFTGSQGTRLLCDPWLADGVFDGSWCHYPPLKTKPDDVLSVDGVYVSHIHPDHFDERHFNFRKDIPIFILGRPNNFLGNRLTAMEFTNVCHIEDGDTQTFHEFSLTMFSPFAKHNFFNAKVGNIIDSALVIEDNNAIALNANDNTPTQESCEMLRNRFGTFDLAMINYNAAGPYPACFDNLTYEEKIAEHDRVLDRNMTYMSDLVKVLQPRFTLPFAGAYVLGGTQSPKNPYLGTTTWDVCASFLKMKNIPGEVLLLREGDTFDLTSGTSDTSYVPLDVADMQTYINDVLSKIIYLHETDDAPQYDQLRKDIRHASERMLHRSVRFGLTSTFQVVLNVYGHKLMIYPKFSEEIPDSPKVLECTLDERLLARILKRDAHWNNAEIGCHISFIRTPNEYEPDLHTMLQFLHL